MSAVQFEGGNMATEPVERAVMAALVARGHYLLDEPDAFLWANHDATNVVRCLDEHGRTFEVAWDALVDTGLHNGEDEVGCLTVDIETVLGIVEASCGGGG